jgi:penicillin amidase
VEGVPRALRPAALLQPRVELGYEWGSPVRFERIVEQLGAAERKFTVEDFQHLQHDVVSLPARRLVRLLAAAAPGSPELRPWAARLTGWDGAVSRDSSPAALYEIWVRKLPEAVFRPKLGDSTWRIAGGFISEEKTLAVLEAASPRWFGAGEAGRAARDAALWKALGAAVEEVRRRLGPDPEAWRWGAMNVTPFHHPLATDPARAAVLDLRGVERGGDGDTVMASGGAFGASFREVLDTADWDRSTATSVPGQSGQPGSPHYGDLLPLWEEGTYFPLLFSRERIERAATGRLVLEPAAATQ